MSRAALTFLVPLLAWQYGCGPRCGPGTHEEAGQCVVDSPATASAANVAQKAQEPPQKASFRPEAFGAYSADGSVRLQEYEWGRECVTDRCTSVSR